MADEPKKIIGVNVPPPAMGGAPNFVVAVLGNPLSGQPQALLTGAMLCTRCWPKKVPAFHVFEGRSLCEPCLEWVLKPKSPEVAP